MSYEPLDIDHWTLDILSSFELPNSSFLSSIIIHYSLVKSTARRR